MQAWVSVMRWYADKRRHAESELQKYADPPSDRLLPDLPPNARHIKTLVLDLDDVLVHSDWTRGRGWRTFKRPGAEDFIRDMAQYYELVVYTAQLPTYADPILDRLDPQRLVTYRLYRDSTQYVNGKHVRDLSKLNRGLEQVLLVTADPDAYALQPDNAIKVGCVGALLCLRVVLIVPRCGVYFNFCVPDAAASARAVQLPKWTTTAAADTTLLDLLPFLEAVVRTNVTDVRDVVRSYEGQDVPTAFRERMAKVQAAKAQRQKAPRGFLSSARS
jgi:import inner membrane translocase subunit TIM50